MLYADTSAIVRAFFVDEPEHVALQKMLLDGTEPVVTSEVAWIEFTSAVWRAHRAGRLPRPEAFVSRFEADVGARGRIALLALEPHQVFPAARRLLATHELGSLDAVHLATALEQAALATPGDEIVFVTRDAAQARAARELGLDVR